jgi:tRNA A-37 threonylcarbamoyl transferase component Bud32
MPFPFLAMLGAYEILAIFIILALLGTAVLGAVAWIVHAIRNSPARQGPARSSPPPPPPFSSAYAGPAGGPVVSGSAELRPPGACPRCGTALGEGAPAGLCPKCLLAVGMGTQPEAPGAGGAGNVPADPAELAALFPQYEIFEAIGQGGMGVVYRAKQRKLERLVALKVLPREAARDPAFAERFHREARTLARLNHPHIVTVYDFGETGGLYYLVMEYVDGADLRRVLEQGRLSPAEALRIVPVVCDALQFAHANGVVHRDIKPGNILLDREGRVKIADFGIAKLAGVADGAADITLTRSRQSVGTPHYMAPEQVENPQSVDHRADIYSLGVVFYEMLTGELPLGRFAPPSRRVQVDVRLDEVVLRALEKEPDRRYQQVAEVKTELARLGGEPGPAPGAGAPVGGGISAGAGPRPSVTSDRTGPGWKLVVGVVWAALFLVFFATWRGMMSRNPDGTVGGPNGVALALSTLGAWAPVGTTVLGWLALRESLRRGERGVRRWLAVGLTGLFPAVSGLFAVFAVSAALAFGVLEARGIGSLLVVMAILSAILGFWVVAPLVRRVRGFLMSDAGRGDGGWIPGLPGRRAIAAVIGVGLVEVVLVMSMLVLFAQSVHRNRLRLAAPTAAPVFEIDPTTGTLSLRRPIQMTPIGPRLDDWLWIGPLSGIPASRQGAVNEALVAIWTDYRAILRRQASRSTNAAGHDVITVRQFRTDIDDLENRFWTVADAGLDTAGQRTLRRVLGPHLRREPRLGRPPGSGGTLADARSLDLDLAAAGQPPRLPGECLFDFGETDATLEFWTVGAWFRWAWIEGTASTEGVPGGVGTVSGEGPGLSDTVQRLLGLLAEAAPSAPQIP